MKLLCFDTTAKTATAAVVTEGKILAESSVTIGLTHSQTLMPLTDGMLKAAGITLSDIDLVAVSHGPGSFTGVRIGVSTIKGLAFSTGKPCVGVSSLASLAKNLEGLDGLRVPVMDARRQQVYTAIYNKEGNCVFGDSLIPLSALCDELAKSDEPIWLAGDGYLLAHRFISGDERLVIRLKSTPPALLLHNAASAALLAEEIFRAGKCSTDSELRPVYLRDSQAERERKEKLNK